MEETIRRWTPPEDLSRKLAIPSPQTDAELKDVIWRYLGISIPDQPVTPGRSTPFRALAEAYFARSPVSVWKGARALAGKTFTLAVLSWLEAVTLRCDVSLLGGSQDQSNLVHEYMRKFWNKPAAPIGALLGDPGRTTTRLVWGNKIRALAASQTSARGGHPPRLRLDEVDEMDFKIYEAIMGQPMAQDGVQSQVVISSTQQYDDKTMSKVLAQAVEHNWSIHEWGYQETLAPHGWLSPAEVARKRSQMTAESWRVEVELGEPVAEGRAIATEKVERMFMGESIPTPGGPEFPYAEFEPPVPGAHYAHGWDWARSSDFVEGVTFRDDVTPLRLVAYQRFRKRPVDYIEGQYRHQTERYPGSVAHDETSMGGQFMNDIITRQTGVELDQAVEGVTMTGRVRQNLFTSYILAIEHEEVVSPRVEVLYKQHKFVRNEDLKPGGKGHPPDGFVAGAMAYRASTEGRQPLALAQGSGLPAQPRQDQFTTQHAAPVQAPQPTGFARAVAFLANGNGHGSGPVK